MLVYIVHCYCVVPSGLWSVPRTTGECPPPCGGFTFTRVDRKRGVMFGGYQPGIGRRVADTYILNFETWVGVCTCVCVCVSVCVCVCVVLVIEPIMCSRNGNDSQLSK